MLHEILLSLSGHPSALFDSDGSDNIKPSSFPLLSQPEAELLSGIKRLAQLHRLLRAHSSTISSEHPSTICRAVATAISSIHLARFQQKILDVEAEILRKDATYVGAYNIVPLAAVVGEFEGWSRLMEWLWDLVRFIMRPQVQKSNNLKQDSGRSTGAGIIDKLRLEQQTGFPEIEEAALELGKVAETTWLRHLSSWVLYGRLPSFSTADFFIQADEESEQGLPGFQLESKLLPKFVSQRTASSILFVGKSLNHIYAHRNGTSSQGLQTSQASELDLLPVHLQYLSKVETPVSSAALADAISSIRFSLSKNLLHYLLPLPKIVESLTILQEFFLLGRGEFAVALISEAEEWRRVRSHKSTATKDSRGQPSLRGVLIKEGELATVMNRTWASLSTIDTDEDSGDSNLELGRDLVHLVIPQAADNRPGTPGRAKERSDGFPKISTVVFNDLLLSVPVKLAMDLRSPIDLFISSSELDLYSSINSYLLGVRRAHWRLTGLWKQSTIRRDHPAPPLGNSTFKKRLAETRRKRSLKRGLEMRKVWATCGAAVFLLSETGAYFMGEVIDESCHHFRSWVLGAASKPGRERGNTNTNRNSNIIANTNAKSTPGSPRTPAQQLQQQMLFTSSQDSSSSSSSKPQSHDPETLASAHRAFLSALSHALLLTDVSFTRSLRSFIANIDALIAFIYRLQSIQMNLDLEEDEGVVDALASFGEEEKEVGLELDRARKKVDSDMKGLVGRLRELDSERSAGGPLASASRFEGEAAAAETFEPWREGGVDRLLMKLDFGRMAAGEEFLDSDED